VKQVDVAETRDKEHGRLVHRRLQSTTRLTGVLDWPGVQQVTRLVRVTRHQGQEVTEVEYGITSVPRADADAATLLAWRRGHWGIENRSHYVRDVTLGEDACPIQAGHAPQNLAALRNAVISLLRIQGAVNIAEAIRAYTWNPHRLFAMLGILKE
jgi:predicted transposase YbfD/YdcC